jgi:protease I
MNGNAAPRAAALTLETTEMEECCMAKKLEQMKVAILATDGFEQSELLEPKKALDEVEVKTEIIAPKSGEIRGWNKKEWGDKVRVDKSLDIADPAEYDALVLPGGVMNPDHLRMNPRAVEFVKSFVDNGKLVAAICHGPWTLIEAGAVRGKTFTSWPSLQTDLRNAGANWVDKEVVRDGQFISSRKPDDIPAFTHAILDALEEQEKSKAA